jgi:hypothetical protein
MQMLWRRKYSIMRLLIFAILFSLLGCFSFKPGGIYAMKNNPKTILLLNTGGNFQFILDYKNPYITEHTYPEQYYFQTYGTWKLKGRDLILNSGRDSVRYAPFYLISAQSWEKDSSRYMFIGLSQDTIPIVSVKSNIGRIQEMNNASAYSIKGVSKDTLQFYFFGYRPVTIISNVERKDYKIRVVPEYRPAWLKDMKLRIKTYRTHGKRIVTLNWKYLEELLNNETDKKYSVPKF